MLHQNGQHNNGFAYSPVVDAPYAMRPESDDSPAAYPPCPSDYPAVSPKPELPGWRDAEPRFVHSLKWHDHDGIEHLHVVRSDDLDDVIKQIGMVKCFIKAARQRGAKPAPEAEPAKFHAGAKTVDSEPAPTAPQAPERYAEGDAPPDVKTREW